MQGFVQGADRQQTTLLPECLDDWVDESNPVRAVDCTRGGKPRPASRVGKGIDHDPETFKQRLVRIYRGGRS